MNATMRALTSSDEAGERFELPLCAVLGAQTLTYIRIAADVDGIERGYFRVSPGIQR